MFIPTSWVTVLRENTDENSYGDEVDSYKAVQTGVGVHISERAPSENYLPGDSRETTVMSYMCLIPHGLQLQKADRLKDESTDDVYLVDHVYSSRSFVGGLSERAVLRRIT